MFFDPLSQSEKVDFAYPTVQETIPRSDLGYGSNNVYPGFPPLMTDGRSIIASYQPEAVKNKELLESSGIKSNWQYRKYLTNNSKQIAEQNFKDACNDTGYTQRFTSNERDNQKSISNVPFMYNSYLDNSKPVGYSNSDLKDLYLSREQLNARRDVPSITQEDLIKTLNFTPMNM
jgi:hypothetical protein